MADNTDQTEEAPNTGLPSLSVDWELYADSLEDSDLTDDQKKEFIETLWNLVVAFVDLGFGVHPLQQACEQKSENRIVLPHDLIKLDRDLPDNQTDQCEPASHSSSATKEDS